MKANAPERIWIDPLIDLQKLNGHINNDSVEYIRADFFIEKAAVWFANRYQVNGSYLCADDTDDFEKYMKSGIKNDKIIVFESGLKEQK